ncbi:hypothetical protein GQX73_g3386 [Xylaria multiplex]|uniref:Helicase C-terminal domain-containing protein n=1 Tax=Xylaria multiplex TaxID=323545 RepID=A0A7C8J3Z3_9PEZI|nr:hypothetical protein GQX73_g3386 [Xylaria multiplex]
MAVNFTHQYIPAGCLLIDVDEHLIPPNTWALVPTHQWYFFSRRSDNLPAPLALPVQLQDALLATNVLTPFGSLWAQGWIRMAYATQPAAARLHGLRRVRVYVLPHDVNRSTQTSRAELIRSMVTLLRQLEYSNECWLGKDVYTPQAQQLPNGQYSDGSFLINTLFNKIPSPDPHPEAVSDPDLRWAMQCLLESRIPGLVTTLYPYQGRSAALMLQRELEPGRIIDPRLRPVLDQASKAWYCDEVSGLVLKEPRFYDGARGGILAEEMGTGKTLICLALILSTKSEPSKPPDPFIAETPPRQITGSLMDMAAAAANKHSIAWKPYFEACTAQRGYEYQNCIRALTRHENRALYKVKNTLVEPRRSNRIAPRVVPSKDVFLSHLTLIVVPSNLIKQWQDEINKHTTGLNVLVLVNNDPIPSTTELLFYDVILFSESRLERIQKERWNGDGPALDIYCPLEYIHFKRCIIDEGHKLGNGSRAWKSDVMRVIERLEISARWVVTGTPSRGLYGVQLDDLAAINNLTEDNSSQDPQIEVARKQERDDLQRIGNLTAKYLKVRPWANSKSEAGDSVADWEKKAIPISAEDEDLLRQAIEFGKQAAQNRLKDVSNRFHSMPIYVQDFPGGRGKSWSLDNEETEEGLVCTDAGLIHSLQNFLNPCIDAPTSLQLMIDNGTLDQQGIAERSQALAAACDADQGVTSQTAQSTILAGNTPLGGDYHTTPKSKNLQDSIPNNAEQPLHTRTNPLDHVEIAEPLAKTRIISTVSAKLSYLIDSIIKHQDNEQILIFYDNDNVAFYLASVLEILQIQHLIYSKVGLNAERRAQYVATFTKSPKFRVLLMDISQAAFGLNMQSASRIYFISPVLNPQVMAQAIGRARRISQEKPVSVETLVLRNSIEEVMIDRREHMTQAEHSRIKSILDDGKIKEWIRKPKIHPMTDAKDGLEQTALLSSPQYVFGRGFGRALLHPDEGLITGSPEAKSITNSAKSHEGVRIPFKLNGGLKRALSPDQAEVVDGKPIDEAAGHEKPTRRRVQIAWADQEA